MEKNMENQIETGGIQGTKELRRVCITYIYIYIYIYIVINGFPNVVTCIKFLNSNPVFSGSSLGYGLRQT